MFIYAGIIGAVIFGSFALIFFQRAKALQNILSRGAKQYDELSQELESIKGRLSAAEASAIALKKELTSAEAARETESARHAKVVSELASSQTNLERKLSNAELQRDHILGRFETLQSERELMEADVQTKIEQIRTLEAEKIQLERDLEDSVKKVNGKIKSENDELRRKLAHLEKESSQVAAQASDLKELEKLRRRAAHNEQLYQSMKSLRDMADERNRNWEHALRSLATWILSSSSVARPNDPVLSQSIGPLVGEALERIGGSLIDANDDVAMSLDEQGLTTTAEP